jgi:hypothetical protein
MQGAEYEKKIAVYNWDNILDLWKGIESGNTPGWESGKALEYLILRAFQLEGAEVQQSPRQLGLSPNTETLIPKSFPFCLLSYALCLLL